MRKLYASLLGLFFVGCIVATAQTLNSGYFLDHYNYGHTINPAFQPDKELKSYFGLLIGNTVANTKSNIGTSAILYPVGDELVFGLNKNVPAEVFLGNLKPTNQLRTDVNTNFLNIGARTGEKGYLTFDVGLKLTTDSSIPKSFFEMLKNGVKETGKYEIKDINVWVGSYLECALGYSHKIGNKFSVGARVKLLFGLAQSDMQINNLSVYYGNDKKVYASGAGMLGIACPALSVNSSTIGPDSFKVGAVGIAGMGFGVDLGISYRPIEDLCIDLAVQNLGKINWNRNINSVMDYKDRALSTGTSVKAEDFFEFKQIDKETISTGIPTTYRVGLKYFMPFYRKLSVRALGTLVSGNHYDSKDIRAGLTITPVKQVSATVNYGYTDFGSTMGAAVNFNFGFLNLFVGADSIIHQITPQGLPVNAHSVTVNGGITLQIKNKDK